MDTRLRGILVIIGGLSLFFTGGSFYTFGNVNTYITSYMRWYGSAPNLQYTTANWMFATAQLCIAIAAPIGGLMEKKLGGRLTILAGTFLIGTGVMSTYFTIKKSFILTSITFGALQGLALGVSYTVPLGCVLKWYPGHRGLVSGIIFTGMGAGAFMFDQIQTSFVNPENFQIKSINTTTGGDKEQYFTEPIMLERVPDMFLLLGGIYVILNLIASVLVIDPPESEVKLPAIEKSISEKDPLAQHSYQHFKDDDSFVKNSQYDAISQDSDIDDSKTPLEMVKTFDFYILFALLFCFGQGANFVSGYYKAFGQTFIKDDRFLTLVGAVSNLFNGLGRLFWGFLADKTSVKMSCILLSFGASVLILTLQFTENAGRGLFFVYICLLIGFYLGCFPIFTVAISKCYGQKYFTTNYGLLYTSQAATAAVSTLMSQTLIHMVGWNGLLYVTAGFSLTGLLLSMMIRAKDNKGRTI